MFKHAITSAAKAFGTQSRNLTAASNQSVIKRTSGRSDSQRNRDPVAAPSTTAERWRGRTLRRQDWTASHLSHTTTPQPTNVEARVRNVIRDQLRIPEEDVLLVKHFHTDLGISDHDFLKLCMALEREFGVGIKASVINTINTVHDAVQYLDSSQTAMPRWPDARASSTDMFLQVSRNSTWSNKNAVFDHPQFLPGRTVHAHTWPSEPKERPARKPEQERPG